MFLAYNGSVCETSCDAPQGPTCVGACTVDEQAGDYNKLLQFLQEATFTDAQGRTSPSPAADSGVLVNGVVVEVTILASRPPSQQPVNGTGMYSLTHDAWLEPPTYQPDNWAAGEILGNASAWVADYNALLCEYEAAKAAVLPAAPGALEFDCGRWGNYTKALRKYRGSAFDANLGSRSTANLAYRLLRRISVNVVDQAGIWKRQCDNMKASLPVGGGGGRRGGEGGAAGAAGAGGGSRSAGVAGAAGRCKQADARLVGSRAKRGTEEVAAAEQSEGHGGWLGILA